MKTVLATLAAAVAAFSPVLASAEPKAMPSPSENTEASAPAPAAKGPTRYCYLVDTTGSRITQKVCRTREQWSREGVEVPANL